MKEGIIFGIIQGLTEFLPISSSGHLFILKKLFEIDINILPFVVYLHLATLLSLVVFFYKDIVHFIKNKKVMKQLLITTLVTFVCAALLMRLLERYFDFKFLIAIGFLTTSLFLFTTRKDGSKSLEDYSPKDSMYVGFMQALAIIPGISRSGITITVLMRRGFKRKDCFVFSFLLAIPVIIAATLLEGTKIIATGFTLSVLINSFLLAFFSGLIALKILKKYIDTNRLYLFSYYCIIIFLVVIFL